jgi:hypothetical protein
VVDNDGEVASKLRGASACIIGMLASQGFGEVAVVGAGQLLEAAAPHHADSLSAATLVLLSLAIILAATGENCAMWTELTPNLVNFQKLPAAASAWPTVPSVGTVPQLACSLPCHLPHR